VYRKWGLPGRSYKAAAKRLSTAGYRTTEQDFKNALRSSSKVPENLFQADAPGIRDFILAVLAIWPDFEWWRMVWGAAPDYLRESVESAQVEGVLNA